MTLCVRTCFVCVHEHVGVCVCVSVWCVCQHGRVCVRLCVRACFVCVGEHVDVCISVSVQCVSASMSACECMGVCLLVSPDVLSVEKQRPLPSVGQLGRAYSMA